MSEFQLKNKVKIVTAASLFDGHDAAINIMRRIIQSKGVEVVHLGHNRSVSDIVNTAIQEDANAIAITSYQGGHVEFFKYMYDLLQEQNCGHIKIFGGGGGTILPTEIKELMDYGITRIYSPDDGRAMGLEGMIIDLISKCDYPTGTPETYSDYKSKEDFQKAFETCDGRFLAKLISTAENFPDCLENDLRKFFPEKRKMPTPVLGITGTGGAGKSSMIDEIVRRFLLEFDDQPNGEAGKKIAILSVDPSKRKTGGALLGDRIRMNSINNERVFMRSLATRQSNLALSKYVNEAVEILKLANFDLIILETSGIGQSDTEIVDHSDVSMYIMTPEFGAASQLEKIDMLDFADIVAINKFDKRGALDALRDVKKAYQRNHNLWDVNPDLMPIYGTIASQFNDPGTNELFVNLMRVIGEKYNEKYGGKELGT